jgi:RHH-type transcriptional regulator, rel operon repressor / antitoxin RelB
MISLRLPSEIETKLRQIAKSEKSTKTEVIKKALYLLFSDYESKQNAYDLGKDLFGKHGSPTGDLSVKYKKVIRNNLREKHTH